MMSLGFRFLQIGNRTENTYKIQILVTIFTCRWIEDESVDGSSRAQDHHRGAAVERVAGRDQLHEEITLLIEWKDF